MGSSQSRPQGSALADLSVEDVQSYVLNLGDKYKAYGDAVAANAVDGELLMDMESVAEFKEMMECLEISNFVHQRVLTKEWKKARGINAKDTSSKATKLELRRTETCGTAVTLTDASEITLDTALTTVLNSAASTNNSSGPGHVRKLPREEEDEKIPPCCITVEHQKLLLPLNLPRDTTLLPADAPELQPFQQVCNQLMNEVQGSFCQCNLLNVEVPAGTNQKGINSLASAPFNARLHFDQPEDHEICRKFILQGNQDFHIEDIPKEVTDAFGMKERAKYYGHVITYGNLRVGTICTIIQDTPGKATTLQQKQQVLANLASVVQGHLEERHALLQRAQNLRHDLQHIHKSGIDPELAPPVGPLRAVTATQVANRLTLFPYPAQDGPNGCPTQPSFTRRSASLPMFDHQASLAERCHLHPTLLESLTDQQIDAVPIGHKDMEQVAHLQSLQLLQMTPDCPHATMIQSLLDTVAQILPIDLIFVNLLDHQHCHVFFPTFVKPWPQLQASFDRYELVQSHDSNGQPFHLRGSRAHAICNYAVATPNHQAFVVHETQKDQSCAHHHTNAAMGFYSGAPIVVRGVTVGCLCVMRQEPFHEFGRVQEVQHEQFAQLVAQQYELWALNREVQRLERERSLFYPTNGTTAAPTTPSTAAVATVEPPVEYAALVFTDIVGAAALRDANEPAMDRAVSLHNGIVQSQLAQLGGYQVSADERGAFYLAFADVVDAVQFCLKTQQALYDAPWGEDLLALPKARHEGAFRGLRTKMAVHCGDVDCEQDLETVAYSGETCHISKSLQSMGHGGQILITSDVWNVASQFVDTTLGSPQVMDLGAHVMPAKSTSMQDGVTTKSVLQLVPASLAHDYRESRRLGQVDSRVSAGRVFPRIKTKKSVSASFLDAPFADNKVSLVCIDTSDVEAMVTDPGLVLAALSKRISTLLGAQQPDGYQCEDFLVAFEDSVAAVRFGLALQDCLLKESILDLSLEGKVRVGVYEGIFESMEPNPTTGRAQYSGRVGEYTALIARVSSPGAVYLGKEAEEMDEFSVQPASNGFMLEFAGRKCFENVEEEFTIYRCQPCKSWYDKIVDNRNGRSSLQAPWGRSSLQTPWRDRDGFQHY